MHDYTVLFERPDCSTFSLTFSNLPQARKHFNLYDRSMQYDAVYLIDSKDNRILDCIMFVLPF